MRPRLRLWQGAMPPKGWRKPPQTVAQAQGAGISLLTRFFHKPAVPLEAELPMKKRGRPPKEETRGRKRADGEAFVLSTQESDSLPVDYPEPVETRLVTTRVNWSQGDDAKRLQAAVEDWDHKTGEWLSLTPSMSLHMYARCVGISKSVLHKYTHPDPAKRTKLGSHAGKPTLLSEEVQQFGVDVLCRRDRGNEGLSNRDCSRAAPRFGARAEAASKWQNCLRQTVRPRFASVLTNIVKAQASTSKRSQVTVAQQYRWHQVIGHSNIALSPMVAHVLTTALPCTCVAGDYFRFQRHSSNATPA